MKNDLDHYQPMMTKKISLCLKSFLMDLLVLRFANTIQSNVNQRNGNNAHKASVPTRTMIKTNTTTCHAVCQAHIHFMMNKKQKVMLEPQHDLVYLSTFFKIKYAQPKLQYSYI